jgi:LCP family protein required for cell wall assembly
MLEDALRDTFARHETLVPDGARIIEGAAATARTRRRRRWTLGSATAAAAALVVAVAAPVGVRWAMPFKQEKLLPDVAAQATTNVSGPLNFLVIGLDKRANSPDPGHADSVMIVHVPADRSRLYLITLARDLDVGLPGQKHGKLNLTYQLGGFQETAKKVTEVTGITFNGGATVGYKAMTSLVNALGGVHMCIDQTVASEHYDAQGKYHTSTSNEGVPQYTYRPGCRDLKAWEALDYARQRKGLPNGDYDRQRHVAQLFAAILTKVKSSDALTNIGTFNELRQAAGSSLTVDLGNIAIADLLRTLRPALDERPAPITTPLGGFNSETHDGVSYQELNHVTRDFYAAVRADTVAQWAAEHEKECTVQPSGAVEACS